MDEHTFRFFKDTQKGVKVFAKPNLVESEATIRRKCLWLLDGGLFGFRISGDSFQ